jgi:hypothetical protein
VTHHFTPETENVDFDDVTKKNMIWLQQLTAWTDWFVTRNGEKVSNMSCNFWVHNRHCVIKCS